VSMRFTSKAVGALGATAVGMAVLYAWRRKTEDPVIDQPPPMEEREGRAAPAITRQESRADVRPRGTEHRDIRRARYMWLVFAASSTLTVVAPLAIHYGDSVAAAICLLGGMVLSAVILRGPERRYSRVLTGVSAVLFALQFVVAALSTVWVILSLAGAPALLEVSIFGVSAFGIMVCLAVTWLPEWRYAEPLALGLIAVILGALCFPGLSIINQQIAPPFSTGAALLFAAGKPDQQVKLYVSVAGLDSFSGQQSELFQVSNLSAHPVRWALLAAGGACLSTYSVSRGVRIRHITGSGIGLNTSQDVAASQLFSGDLSAGSTAVISGTAEENFADSTSDQTAVSLPSYGQGVLSVLSAATQKYVTRALDAPPVFMSPDDFTTQIDAGSVFPLQSVTSASLAPVDDPSVPDTLEWTIHNAVPISYAITDQEAQDGINNFLFAFAVLLGVAGAAMMASLQGAIHASLSRSKSKRRQHPENSSSR